MNVFEKSYEQNPPLYLISKSGVTHVHPGGPPNRQGVARALCGARPPMFGFDVTNALSLFPSPFGTPEGEAPSLWREHTRALEEVNCGTCRAELQRAVELAWRKTGLASYGRGDWIDLNHARALIAAIPKGRWTGYGDVTEACGAPRTSGATLLYFLDQDKHGSPRHVCRVLYDDGSSNMKECRAQIEAEGVTFTEDGSGVADPSNRMTPDDLAGSHASGVVPSQWPLPMGSADTLGR